MTEPITRIEAALSQLGREHEPPAGWEARVLAATAGPRRKPWWLFATSALAVAGAAAVIVTGVVPREPAEPVAAFALEAPWDKGPATVRGDSPHVGDLVHATARGGGGYRAVWVYRNEDLVAACPGGQACRFEGDKTIADVRLLSIAGYRIVALSSVVPLAPPRGVYDSDVANALRAQATYLEHRVPLR